MKAVKVELTAERAGEQYHKQFTNHHSKAGNYIFPNSLL
jgi:hypothetical protein